MKFPSRVILIPSTVHIASHPMQMPKGSAITKREAADAIYVISRISGEGADRKAELETITRRSRRRKN